MEFRLLGPVEVWAGEHRLDAGPPQRRAVLAAMLVDAGRLVIPETVIDRVWGDRPPAAARRTVQAHIARIRSLLGTADGARLVSRSGGYHLDVAPESVDWHRFRASLRAATAGPDDERADRLDEALALWRGEPLADVPGEWAARTRENWRRQRLDAALLWADASLRVGRHEELVGPVRDLLDEHPFAEPLVSALMRALAAGDRKAEALDAYARLRTRLADELGTDPGPELRQVYEAVLRGQVPPARAEPGAARRTATAGEVPAQLPGDVPGFVGRRREVARLDAVADTSGADPVAVVIAVSGTAGVGKTALAVHWAHRVRNRFPDGQLYVNLRGFDPGGRAMEPGEALRALLAGLGAAPARIPAGVDAQVGLYRSLTSGRRLLVVLDNARDAEQVLALLPGDPASLVLVTSRDRLTALVAGVGAQPVMLDLLPADEARRLLAARLGDRRVRAEPEAVDLIVAACAGLPLALTIAAARAQSSGHPLAALAGELSGAGARLDALDAGNAASEVRRVFSWSYAALSPAAARLFRLLSLHPGPDVSATAAAALAGQSPGEARRALAELTRTSLLAERTPGRYACHDLLRAYAADLTQDVESIETRGAARLRKLDHYTHTACAADRLLHPHREPIPVPLPAPSSGSLPDELAGAEDAMAWLRTEHAVLRGLMRQAADAGLPDYTWYIAWAMDTYLNWRGYRHERADAWRAGLDASGQVHHAVARAYALAGLALAEIDRGDLDRAEARLWQALELHRAAGNLVLEAYVHQYLSYVHERRGQPEAALDHERRALAQFEATGRRRGQAHSHNAIGWYHTLLGEHAQALVHIGQAVELFQQLDDPFGLAAAWDSLGFAHHNLGQFGPAVDCYDRARGWVRVVGNAHSEGMILDHLGDSRHAMGDLEAAREAWTLALDLFTSVAHPDADAVRAKLDKLDG